MGRGVKGNFDVCVCDDEDDEEDDEEEDAVGGVIVMGARRRVMMLTGSESDVDATSFFFMSVYMFRHTMTL